MYFYVFCRNFLLRFPRTEDVATDFDIICAIATNVVAWAYSLFW